jgi:Dolichyl-phosphate-mannose-protein mannosyltransferase
MISARWPRSVAPILLACAVLHGAVLRLDALFESFGPYEQPAWLAAAQPTVQQTASIFSPRDWQWPHYNDHTYGGDPVNYLKFAREMRHFYQAHVREPMFVAATRLSLVLTNDADVGISLTSITFGLLTMIATYAVGRQIASPAAGLAAATALGIDYTAIGWSIEGWRDEMFAFFVVLSAWACIRMSRRPSYGSAVLAGIVGAAACLTRITAISFLLPAWLWFAAGAPMPFDRRMRMLGVSVAVTLALVAPYLINCAVETGDPLYAINYHTQFYLDREGAADVAPRNAVLYTLEKFRHPIAAVDTAIRGLTVHPFTTKWTGLDMWRPSLGEAMSWLALLGLFAWCWQPCGRLLLLILAGSLVPYMLTWNIRGGGDWRFTFHAFPFYLLAACWMVDRVVGGLRRALRLGTGQWLRALDYKQALYASGALALLIAAGWSWALFVPYLLARESLLSGTTTTVMAGEREAWLFADGWSDPVTTGNVVARFATARVAEVRIPLPESRAYDVVLRMDPLPYTDAPAQSVAVSLNDSLIDVFELAFNRERVGEYRARLPAGSIRRGMNELTLRSAVMAPVGLAGTAYEELQPDQIVGVRLWCIVIDPVDIMP